ASRAQAIDAVALADLRPFGGLAAFLARALDRRIHALAARQERESEDAKQDRSHEISLDGRGRTAREALLQAFLVGPGLEHVAADIRVAIAHRAHALDAVALADLRPVGALAAVLARGVDRRAARKGEEEKCKQRSFHEAPSVM